MRVLIVTYGSLGDLHPAIALAHGLQARGHEATIATSEPYRAKIAAEGIGFHAVRPDLSLTDQGMVRRIMDGQTGTHYLMRELVYPNIRVMHADLAAAARSADVMITSELVCAAPLVAGQQRIPWAFFALSPISFLSLFDPPEFPGPAFLRWVQQRGSAANRFVLQMARLQSHAWWRPLRALRQELGLSPGRWPLREGKFSPQLNLALFPPMLQAPQPDWPANTVQTGFLFHDEDRGAGLGPALPPAVERFLSQGEPPIVFTLGSAAVTLAHDFYEQSALAAERLGRRAVLLLGKNPPPPNLPSSILACDYLPYAAIFPHAAAIVHQGGIGTTGQALRAGRPMLIMPFAHDQFDNAARVVRLGAGRRIPRERYHAVAAARELGALLESPETRARAAAIGDQIRAERALDATCAAIERMPAAN